MTTEIDSAAQEQVADLTATQEVVVESTAPVLEEGAVQDDTTEVDWQVRAKQAEDKLAELEKTTVNYEAQLEKEREDARSTKLDLLKRIDANRNQEVQERITRATQDDDASGLDTDIKGINQKYAQQEQQLTILDQVNAMAVDIDTEVASSELPERDKVNIRIAWEYAQKLWNEGKIEEAHRSFRETHQDVQRVIDRVERRQIKDAEKARRREDLEQGSANLATPSPTGSGSTSLDSLNAKDMRTMSAKELAQHKEAIFRAWEREDGVTFRR